MSIGGTLDYRLLAQQHRPTDQAALAVEVRRLAQQGLKPLDIAAALNLTCAAVERVLERNPPMEA